MAGRLTLLLLLLPAPAGRAVCELAPSGPSSSIVAAVDPERARKRPVIVVVGEFDLERGSLRGAGVDRPAGRRREWRCGGLRGRPAGQGERGHAPTSGLDRKRVGHGVRRWLIGPDLGASCGREKGRGSAGSGPDRRGRPGAAARIEEARPRPKGSTRLWPLRRRPCLEAGP